jgi:hypothetical protein
MCVGPRSPPGRAVGQVEDSRELEVDPPDEEDRGDQEVDKGHEIRAADAADKLAEVKQKLHRAEAEISQMAPFRDRRVARREKAIHSGQGGIAIRGEVVPRMRSFGRLCLPIKNKELKFMMSTHLTSFS